MYQQQNYLFYMYAMQRYCFVYRNIFHRTKHYITFVLL
jgi:hypothetical protein